MEYLNYSTHVVNVLISNQSRKQLANQQTPKAIPSRHLQNYVLIKTIVFDINSMMCERYAANNKHLVLRQAMLDLGLPSLLIQTQEAAKQHFSKLKQT